MLLGNQLNERNVTKYITQSNAQNTLIIMISLHDFYKNHFQKTIKNIINEKIYQTKII